MSRKLQNIKNRVNRRKANQETAIDAYIDHLETAREALDRINAYIADNGEVGPEDVTWAHTGSMARIANELKEIQDRIDETGEYA